MTNQTVRLFALGGVLTTASLLFAACQPSTPISTTSPTTQTLPTQSPAASTAPATTQNVTIQNFAFGPATLTVKAGTTLTWTNKDSMAHTATADDGTFDTESIAPNTSKSITFNTPGTFAYHCSVHPSMHATIIVQ
ncbi:amidase [Candidatus Cerribacteria bacterium 'Amazon FNV 2010 28 9']|uniref:Amidase n=1 Tax=Candidatus Cerribacteria bacterium 'Amazon FNV 2010 28 9' TaxID=2081795 RepID=A0A317JPU6_9BACT|nr:MAG: amidase [Candidatus Cerribacteria bacterium 'Amazon FNV 2010 28 9']